MPQSRHAVLLGAVLTVLTAAGCEDEATPTHLLFVGPQGESGAAGSAQAQAGASMAGAATSPTPEGFLPDVAPSSVPLRRLTRTEYRNLVREVLGIEPPPDYSLPQDWSNAGFSSTADELTTVAAVDRYLDAALDTGERLLPTIRTLMPCEAVDLAGERACIDSWLTSQGPRLFRRPMSDQERSRFLTSFEQARAQESYEQSASLVVEELLVAPELLFIELPSGGQPGDVLPLDSWQMAARLSFLLWDSIPDQPLLVAAERDELTSPEALAEQVERMLDDPRAQATVRSFFDDWLGLDEIAGLANDPNAYPFLERDVTAALAEETRAYVEDVFLRRDFREMFVSSQSEVTEQSFGLLSQTGFLMTLAHAEPSSPIHRGAFVRRKLLCGRLPSAPPGVAIPLPEPTPGQSKRERITAHTASAQCVGCHGTFNTLGFALEHFDIAGAWRDTDGKLPIDTHVSFDEPGLHADVDGALQLSQALADSPSARACAIQQLFTFALERPPTSADRAWFDELGQRFETSGFSLRALITELTLSDGFRTRIEPGALP